MHPSLVRRLVLPLVDWLLRRQTLACLRRLTQSQHYAPARLRELQVRKLRDLLIHAHHRVPAWRRRIDDAQIDPRSVDIPALARLPLLDKQTLRGVGVVPPAENPFCDPRAALTLRPCNTGGSTGEPLRFFVDPRRIAADQAARARSRRWFGIEPGEREFYLWGAPVELRTQDRLRALRDRLINHCLVSAFDLAPDAMNACLERLRRYDPVHLFGYPSSLARLARHALARGRRTPAPSLRAAFTTGEVLLPRDRQAIRDWLGVPVADGYGSREAGFIAHECPAGRMHVTMECVLVELIDAQGRPVAPGQQGEIVVTHLDAFGMPFIRYRTGDISHLDPRPCPCGLAHPTLGPIQGRTGDAILTPGGGYAHPLSVIYPLRDAPFVKQFRVVQRRDLTLDVDVVPLAPLAEPLRRRLADDIARQFHHRLPVNLRIVPLIPPDAAGKHRVVRSEAAAPLPTAS